MTRIYLIRHAEAEGNLYRRVQGWYDSRVTENGLRQIAALEHRFQNIHLDAVYASDLRRTQCTAQAVTRPKNLTLRIDPGLREIGLGVYEDLSFGDMEYHHPDSQGVFATCSPQWDPEGGETFDQVCRRITAAFFRIAAAHPEQTVAVFSHGTAIRCLQASLRGKHPSQVPELGQCENTAVSCYDIKGSQFRILFENDASHLPLEIATLARQKAAWKRDGDPLHVWFQPLDMDRDAQVYYEARKEAWQNIHGSLANFDGPAFLSEAREQWQWDRRAVQRVLWGEQTVGILHLATLKHVQEAVGYIPFLYLMPNYRRRGIGVQLIGQAVSTYRAMGRRRLRLNCAPNNEVAQRFYKRYGFVKVGQDPGAQLPLDRLEKEI